MLMGSRATTTNFKFWPSFKFFFVYRTLSMRQKTKNHQNQGSIEKNSIFSPVSQSHTLWGHLVQKTRAKNSHAWAPLRKTDREGGGLPTNSANMDFLTIWTLKHLLAFFKN